MTGEETNIEFLKKEINYLKRRVKELTGSCLKNEYAISGLGHELRQKRQGMTLLSELQQSISVVTDISSIFENTVKSINSKLIMSKSVILTPEEKENYYRPNQWMGFTHEQVKTFPSLSIKFPAEFTSGKSVLVVTKSTKPTRLINTIRTSFNLPYFICVPVITDNVPIGFIIAGRTKELKPFSPPLDQGDVDTFLAIAGLISAFVRKRRVTTLEETDRIKTEYLANMSHEIRTPMNAILGFAEILIDKVSDEKQLEYLSAIRTSGKSLLGLINDILDLTKVEMGKLELEYEAVDIHAIFLEMKQIFSQKIVEKGIDFIVEIDKDLPNILLLDEIRIRQVLFNLVGNAVKFTDKGYVKLSVKNSYPDKDHSKLDLVCSVEDSGIGIPEDQLDKIFIAFEQQKGQKYAKYGGTGLGLAITKRLVEMMNGEITVTSKVGMGSIFNVILRNIDVASVSKSKLESETRIDVNNVMFEHASVMIVDDVEFNRNMVNGFLEQYDFTIYEAENGEEALEYTRKHLPDLIIMDLKMPVMDGLESTKRLKEDPGTKDIPVVALTATSMKHSKEELETLFDGYMSKPVSKSDLVTELMKFLDHTVQEPEPAGAEQKQPESIYDTNNKNTSGEGKEDFPELLSKLELEILPLWEEIKESAVITDISNFAKRTGEVAESYNYVPLVSWINTLEKQINTFDLDMIHGALGKFPEMISNMKKQLA
jgi:signal transduction histidine kinase/DNA-binding response OmpR family regulator